MLRVPIESITVILADTAMTPDDGGTSGSRTTPATIPSVRQACAAARKLLDDYRTRENKPEATYADLVAAGAGAVDLKQPAPRDIELIAPRDWRILGQAAALQRALGTADRVELQMAAADRAGDAVRCHGHPRTDLARHTAARAGNRDEDAGRVNHVEPSSSCAAA